VAITSDRQNQAVAQGASDSPQMRRTSDRQEHVRRFTKSRHLRKPDNPFIRSGAKLQFLQYAQGQFLVTWEWRKLKTAISGKGGYQNRIFCGSLLRFFFIFC